MKITWYGHSAFRVESGDAKILIDPFLSGNPSWGKGWEGPAEGITHVLLTHGHNDHTLDAAAILKKTGAMLVSNFEICMFLVGQGVDQGKINPAIIGGTVDCGGFTTTFVQALHSSSFSGEGGANTYLGNPNGLVLHFPDDKTLYHMGDTDIFSDMALINELHEPDYRHRADRRPLHHGRRGRGARLPPLLQVRGRASLPLRDVSDDRPERRTSSSKAWRARQPRF